MTKWIHTNDEKWIDKWAALVLSDPQSSFVQLLHRVRAYQKYGMDWELLICVDKNDTVLLGSANVIVKFLGFKIYVCAYGPTVLQGCDLRVEMKEFLIQFTNRAKELGSFASQITVPVNLFSENIDKGKEGRIFLNIPSHERLNLIDLQDDEGNMLTKDELISSFLPYGRRDVRASYRKGLTSNLACTEEELSVAYACFETNAKNKGYFVRSWDDMRDSIIEGVTKKMSFVITAWYEDEIQGAVLLERSANMLSYTMGGVYRHTPDLLTGYFLQMEAMMLASRMNLPFYNVSSGGPKEVQRFKGMFNPMDTECGKPIYFIHKKMTYFVYRKLNNSKIKGILPKILAIKKKLKS